MTSPVPWRREAPGLGVGLFERSCSEQEGDMTLQRFMFASAAAIGIALAVSPPPATAQQIVIDNDDIGGVVTGANGPEPASG